MDKSIIKILIIFVACFFPLVVFGFFAEPDQYLHSMPFGVQKNHPGDIKIIPPTNFQFQENKTVNQDLAPVGTNFLEVAENKENENKSDLPLANNYFLQIFLIVCFFAVLIFLVIKIIIV